MPTNKLSRMSVSALLLIHLILFVGTFFTHHADTQHPFLVVTLALYLFFPLWRLHKGKRWPLALYGATCFYLSFLSLWLCYVHQLTFTTSMSVALTLCLIQYLAIISFYLKSMREWWSINAKSIEKKQAFEAAICGEKIDAIKPRSIRWASYLIALNFFILLAVILHITLTAHTAHLLSKEAPAALITLTVLSTPLLCFYLWRINVGERWLIYPALIIFILKTITLIAMPLSGELQKPYESLFINPITVSIASVSFILSLVSFRFLFSSSVRAWSQSLKIQQLQQDVLRARDTKHSLYLVDPLKLTIMTFVTFGLYLYHWSYRHWKAIRENESQPGKPKIMPIARSILQNLFIFPFLTRLYPNKRLSYTLSFYIIVAPIGFLLRHQYIAPFLVSGITLYIWLYIIQNRTNTIARLSGVDRQINDKYTWLNWVFIGLFVVLMIGIFFMGLLKASH